MKRSVLVLFSVLALAVLALAQVPAWEIDPSHSGAHFVVKHMMVSNVRGEFERMKGAIQYDPNDLSKSSVEAVIETSSISTRNTRRDDHLRSPDFFDAAKFPSITFRSSRFEKGPDGRLRIAGHLTIRDVTREVVLDVEGPSQEIKDQRGNARIGASATTKISRKDFGITWNRALEAGGFVVGDEVQITIDIEAIRKVAVQPAAAQ